MGNLKIPRLVIAGTSSGVGKTTVMAGLCRALRARNLRVAVFKVGPDYLDPTYHAKAAGVASHTLDGWMMGREAVLNTFRSIAHGCDIALIEGVMGLFDGASAVSDEGSTAEAAKWLDAPVLVVVDSSGIARTIGAIAQGVTTFDPDLRVAGILCNNVGSRGHLDLLRQASLKTPVLGGLPKEPSLGFTERHLGLHAAQHSATDDGVFEEWGRRVSEWFDLDRILAVATDAPDLPAAADSEGHPQAAPCRCRIAVARDAAFHFYYEDNLQRLRGLGAELVWFSPIADAHLPAADGLYFGGGYPELHADVLSSNHSLTDEIRAFAGSGKPIYAECGGLMYLSSAIRTVDGTRYPMVGLISGETIMRDRLQALGYVEVETMEPSILGPSGLRFRGHQFRYSELRDISQTSRRTYRLRGWFVEEGAREGYGGSNVLASYVHAHWASNPSAAAGFVQSCVTAREARRTLEGAPP
jgi:cobyrinic acid a,c-diamide synthase